MRAKNLAEVHSAERAKWDGLAPEALDEGAVIDAAETFVSVANKSPLLRGVTAFLGDLSGKRVLEYGCGLGRFTILLARSGAHVTTFDLSPKSVEYVRMRAHANGLADRVDARAAAAERLPFFDESFDVVFGKSILHHIEPTLGAAELHRVTRTGGKAVFSEPLGMNPVLNFARAWMPYPHKHTRGEDQPLRREDLERWTADFRRVKVDCMQLVSMIERGLGFGVEIRSARRLDDWLLHRFPSLGRFCRYAVIQMVK